MGGGVVDRLQQLSLPCIGVDFGSKADRSIPGQEAIVYANKVAEMWGNMKAALSQGLAIPRDEALRNQLCNREYGYTLKEGRDALILESKDDMRGRGLASPDIPDALALTYAYPVLASKLGATSKPKVLPDYDPFNVDWSNPEGQVVREDAGYRVPIEH